MSQLTIKVQNGAPPGSLEAAVTVLGKVLGREPSDAERTILARYLDVYRSARGAEADAEYVAIAAATIALTRGLAADSCADLVAASEDFASRCLTATSASAAKITAAQAGAVTAWRHRVWAAAGLGMAAGALGYWAMARLAGGALGFGWLWEYGGYYLVPQAAAGALAAIAAAMAIPEIWMRARRK